MIRRSISHILNKSFHLAENQTNIRTEFIAAITTFLTMAYIIVVNPSILSVGGMNAGAVFVATCLVCVVGSLLSGLLSNYPIAIAPSLTLAVYFAFTLIKHDGYDWHTALGAVFLSGILFTLLTITNIRKIIVDAIPRCLALAIAAGLGLFIALISLQNMHIIVHDAFTIVTLGNLLNLKTLLYLFCFFMIIFLTYHRVTGAILISIITTTVIGISLGCSQFHGIISMPPSIHSTFFSFRLKPLFNYQGFIIIFTFVLAALFDATGAVLGLLQQISSNTKMEKQLPKVLLADSLASLAGGLFGTSTTAPYIENATGIAAGGRTGLTAIFIAFFFLCSLFFAPLIQTIPSYATNPALLYVGCLMLHNVSFIDWQELSEAVPATITVMMIPFTFSIADGIGAGFISYVIVKLLCGKWRSLNIQMVILAILFVIYFILRP